MNYGEQRQGQKAELADERAKVRRYLSNSNALESIMCDIADGVRLTDLAARLNVSYAAFYSVVTGRYKEQYRAARAAFAEGLAEKNLDMADKVEKLELPHDAAKTAAGLRHWYMERAANEQWGQKSSVDVNHKGVVGLHLEAIRQLAEEPIEGDFEEVDDGDGDTGVLGRDDHGGADDADNDGVDVRKTITDHPLL